MKAIIAFLSLVLFGSVLFAMDEKEQPYYGYARAKGVYFYYDSSTKKTGTREPASIDKMRKSSKTVEKTDSKSSVQNKTK